MNFKRLLNLTSDHLHGLPLLVLYLTDGCNSRCVTCDIWHNPRRNMPLALADSIAQTCPELGTRWVLLSGGEAMQHPEWPRIAQRFRAEGTHVMLLTNGLLLRKQADDVLQSVDEVIVSLDAGTAATYERIRGVDAFDLILDGIDVLRAGGLPVTTRTTVQRQNFREIPRIIEVAQQHDVTTISFLAVDVSNPHAFGDRDLGEDSSALSLAEVEELSTIIHALPTQFADVYAAGRMAETPQKLQTILVDYFHALNGIGQFPAPRCNAPHFSTVVEVDGRLRPCYFLPVYGRLRPDGESLTSAINWDAAQQLRTAYRRGEREECARCVCPLYKGPRALMRM